MLYPILFDVLIQYLKNIQNEKISEQNDKVHLISKGGNIDLHPNTEKIGFNIKSKRFKVTNDDKNPGPGQYHIPCAIVDVNNYTREQGNFNKKFKFI